MMQFLLQLVYSFCTAKISTMCTCPAATDVPYQAMHTVWPQLLFAQLGYCGVYCSSHTVL